MSRHHPSIGLRFPYVDGELTVRGIPLSLLAARVGSTPFYAYDRALMSDRVEELRAELPRQIRLHYAMKANPMPAVVDWIARLVDGIDVASGAELRVALDAGMDPRRISFAGPAKSATELAQAVASGALINVESMRELHLLPAISERLGRAARVALRINPDFEVRSTGMKMGGGARQFGIDAEQVPRALAEIRSLGLAFEGFHVFWGSQNLRAESICDAQRKVLDLVISLAEFAPSEVRSVNFGGGFGIPYFAGEEPLDLGSIGVHLQQIVERAQAELPHAVLAIELGRYLVGEAGIYVAKVLDRKESRGEIFLVTDGGLHHHLSASGNFGQVIRRNYPVALGKGVPAAPTEVVTAVGPLCTPLDVLADRASLPVAAPGDFVVIFQSGAYGLSASPTQFLSHPKPAEVLV